LQTQCISKEAKVLDNTQCKRKIVWKNHIMKAFRTPGHTQQKDESHKRNHFKQHRIYE